MKFYKNPTTGVWTIGEMSAVPALSCYIQTVGEKIIIRFPEGKILYEGTPAGLTRKNGSSYIDLETFLSENKDFFVQTINLEALTDGTQKTKVLNVAGDVVSVATHEDILALIAAVQNGGGTMLKAFSVEITRPANTTVYSAGDVVADVTAAFVKLPDVAKAIGTGVKIVRVRIQTEDTGVAGKKFNLHLYKDAPTFIADNAAFAINYANAAKRIGAIPVVMGTGNLATVGMNDYNQCIVNPTARDVYWILETVDGFTPSANSTKFQITIDCELSN